jgi:large conductance mechanosensitive channel
VSWGSEFRDFIEKGNIITLAIAFVLGLAFNMIVTALVTDVINPLIGIPGHADLASLGIVTVNGSTFYFGAFLGTIVYFVIIALVLFFAVARPYMNMQKRKAAQKDPTTRECPECLSTVPIKAKRCAFCTAPLPPVAATKT